MKILLCIDDTDNLDSRGTGELASILAEEIESQGWGLTRFVTRHQLLVHPDIPYTSHNSSMCFEADIQSEVLDRVIGHAAEFLERESAPGSDPGLCVSVVERLPDAEAVIAFGKEAKRSVLNKQQAYDLAHRLGVHLSEHGGTGQGVVGALAGVGLRLSGNDGRLKGWLDINTEDGTAKVEQILAQTFLGGVRTIDGMTLGPEEVVAVDSKPKAVLLDGQAFLMVSPAAETDAVKWKTTPRQLLKRF
ncbi:MAG: hypothetical protein R2940_00865 [Syntrophotaleaceae bacterium]